MHPLVFHMFLLFVFIVLPRDLSRYDRDASFPEKKGYKPNVKIEYVDDSGRLLNTKEVNDNCSSF